MWNQTRVSERLGIRYPIIQGPFGGGLSTVELTAVVSNAGGLGSFGAHHLSPMQIKDTAAAIRRRTTKPFAMNLWIPLPGEPELRLTPSEFAANVRRLKPCYDALGLPEPEFTETFHQRFEDQIDALLEARPPVFSFVFGIPSREILSALRQREIRTIGAATTVDEALALEEAGVDLIVASGSDAGGHRPSFLKSAERSLTGTFALIPQVADAVRTPIIAAGGMGDERGVIAAFVLGAEAAQLGTLFLATHESGASEAHKAALVSKSARSTALTRVFSGRLARGIRNRFIEEMTPHEADLPPYPIHNWFTQSIRRAAGEAGRADYLSLWAGQAAALSQRRPAAEAFAALVEGIEQSLRAAVLPVPTRSQMSEWAPAGTTASAPRNPGANRTRTS